MSLFQTRTCIKQCFVEYYSVKINVNNLPLCFLSSLLSLSGETVSNSQPHFNASTSRPLLKTVQQKEKLLMMSKMFSMIILIYFCNIYFRLLQICCRREMVNQGHCLKIIEHIRNDQNQDQRYVRHFDPQFKYLKCVNLLIHHASLTLDPFLFYKHLFCLQI